MAGRVARFYINAGDRLPLLVAVVTQESTGALMDFSGWSNPTFSMRRDGEVTPTLMDKAATFGAAGTGKITYAWGAGDTDTPGKYYGIFQGTDPSGKQASFPNDDARIEIYIVPRIDA